MSGTYLSEAAENLLQFAEGRTREGFFVGGGDEDMAPLNELRQRGLCEEIVSGGRWKYSARLQPLGFQMASRLADRRS